MALSIDRQQVIYGERRFYYRVFVAPTRRHKIAIHVHPDGSVQVDAPPNTSAVEIKQAVLKRARWVLKHLEVIDSQQRYVLAREYVSGETHFYLGRRYQLKVLKRKEESVKLLRGKLVIATADKSPEHVQGLIWQWVLTRCKKVFARRLELMVASLNWVDAVPVWKFRKMTKQWGSCSPKGIVSLNPHLVKAPLACIDYVILHELCHLQEHNHSPQFYSLLDRHMPDWASRKAKLDGIAELLLVT